MKINLCAPFLDSSGYGEFSRFFAYALLESGADISCENISLPSSPKTSIDFGIKGSRVKSHLTLSPQPHDVNIVFMIPPLFKVYKRKQGKYNIGFTMFEADMLPKGWAEACNDMDAIFVPSEWNKQGFINSGVTKPIFVIPAGITSGEFASINVGHKKKFTFYSIFQWAERKNPINLIRAYLVAMQNRPDARLVLKTYLDTRVADNKRAITIEIDKIKKSLNLTSYPEVHVITDIISNDALAQLHTEGDCFVSAHRAEGWNMPLMEAMAHGNAVIATGYSGNMQFCKEEAAILIPYHLTPCVNTEGFAPFFNGGMRWAEPNVEVLINKMQYVYSNRDAAIRLGAAARQHILSNFNEVSAAKVLHDALQSVVKR